MTADRCDWPGCKDEATCTTGNAGGGLVCRQHFMITNGTGPETELTEAENAAFWHMARAAGLRRVGTCRTCGGLGQVYSVDRTAEGLMPACTDCGAGGRQGTDSSNSRS